MKEFESLPDPTYDFGVICPLAPEKSTYYLVATLVPSFLLDLFDSCRERGQPTNMDRVRISARSDQGLGSYGP